MPGTLLHPEILASTLQRWLGLLLDTTHITLHEYLHNVETIIHHSGSPSQTEPLWETFLKEDCTIEVQQVMDFKTSSRSLKQYFSSQKLEARLYWQIVVRLLRLKRRCKSEDRREANQLSKETTKLICLMRVVLEDKKDSSVAQLVSEAVELSLNAQIHRPTLEFYDKIRKIAKNAEVDLQELVSKSKKNIQDTIASSSNLLIDSTSKEPVVQQDSQKSYVTPQKHSPTPQPQKRRQPTHEKPPRIELPNEGLSLNWCIGNIQKKPSQEQVAPKNPQTGSLVKYIDGRKSVIRTIYHKQSYNFVSNKKRRDSGKSSEVELQSLFRESQICYYSKEEGSAGCSRAINLMLKRVSCQVFEETMRSITKGGKASQIICEESPPRRFRS